MDAVKLAHHGAAATTWTPEFMQLVDAEHFLFSNGDKFKHPDRQVVGEAVHGARRKPTLWFNYRSAFNERWEAGSQARQRGLRHALSRAGRGRHHRATAGLKLPSTKRDTHDRPASNGAGLEPISRSQGSAR